MGKRYYCDYCERSFADGAENRKKHLASAIHQKFRKAHYDTFKDAATILSEDKMKKPCRKYMNDGACDYGTNCKYSHLTPSDIQRLEEEARLEEVHLTEKPNIKPELDTWIESKASRVDEHSATGLNVSHSVLLPPVLTNIPNLPLSLIPSTVFEFYDAQKKNVQEWG